MVAVKYARLAWDLFCGFIYACLMAMMGWYLVITDEWLRAFDRLRA